MNVLNVTLWLVLACSLAGLATWARCNLDTVVPAQPEHDRPRRLRTAVRGVHTCYVVAVIFLLAGVASVPVHSGS